MSIKISKEMAEQEFQRFVDTMYFDVDEDTMNDDEKETFRGHKSKIVKAISNGSLVINDNGEPTYTPVRSENKDPIHFYEMTGADLMAIDKTDDRQNVKKLYSVMQSITKKPVNHFAKLSNSPDLRVCIAIASLFLAG